MHHIYEIEAIIRAHSSILALVLPPFPNNNDEVFMFSGYEWDLESQENLHSAMDGHGYVIAYFLEGKDGKIAAAEYATEPGRRVNAETWENTKVRLKRAARHVRRRRALERQNDALNERLAWSGQEPRYA